MNSSKKRPPPSTDTSGARANYSDPSITSPHNPHGDQHGFGRPRSFPYDLSVNISKRSSLSESASLTPRSFDEQDTSHLNAWNVGPASAVMTPISATSPFSSQHFGNPNLPDMKPVMFPSDNPFAYPNQPMSTLEAQQSLNVEQPSYSNAASSGMYSCGVNSNPMPASFSFDNTQMPAFSGAFNVPLRFMQQGRQMNAPISGPPSFDAPPQMDEPTDLNAMNFPAGDGYWSQMDRAGGGRTGLTPGGINLDELFGGEGWSNIWNNQSLAR